MKRAAQSGITLVVSLIMLIVLTLLVVSAIRFGNVNLRIASNTQTETEASAAAQVAIEQMLADIVAADKIDTVPAKSQLAVSTGGATYKVDVAAPKCVMSSYVKSTELDPTKEADQVCFGGGGGDPIVGADGKLIAQPTECKAQQWDVAATVNDTSSGAQLTMLQGVAVRVSLEVQCP